MSKKTTKQTMPEPMDAEAARKVARLFLTGCAMIGELAGDNPAWGPADEKALAKRSVYLADAALDELDL